MKHTYKIEGMTCNSCKLTVQDHLSKVDNVTNVEVDLEKGKATISMNKHVQIDVLKDSLPSKYTLNEMSIHVEDPEITNIDLQEESKWQQLKPLFLILLYISIASILLHRKDFDMHHMMLDFMGLFFIVFSFFKMLDLKGFPDSFRMYDLLAKQIPIYAQIYPFIETLLGLMFLLRYKLELALPITIFVLGITTFGVTKTLLDKRSIRCACLGTALKLPMTEATFIENAIMLVMAVVLLIN